MAPRKARGNPAPELSCGRVQSAFWESARINHKLVADESDSELSSLRGDLTDAVGITTDDQMQTVIAFRAEHYRSLRHIQRKVGRCFRPNGILDGQDANGRNRRSCRSTTSGRIDGNDEVPPERRGAKSDGTLMQRCQPSAMRPGN